MRPAGEVAADGGAVQQVLETIDCWAGGQSTANGQAQGRKALRRLTPTEPRPCSARLGHPYADPNNTRQASQRCPNRRVTLQATARVSCTPTRSLARRVRFRRSTFPRSTATNTS